MSQVEIVRDVKVQDDASVSGPVYYAVRVGVHGQIGRFISQERFRRRKQVICRTVRGLEVGEVLSELANGVSEYSNSPTADMGGSPASKRFDSTPVAEIACDGRIVRAMAAEDQLLWNHLRALADEAQLACQSWLEEYHATDQLLEVEPLLDGRTLYFHFLNEVSPQTESHLQELAQIFQATVARSDFAKLLDHGCGPGCGTSQARGCGSACASCHVTKACRG